MLIAAPINRATLKNRSGGVWWNSRGNKNHVSPIPNTNGVTMLN